MVPWGSDFFMIAYRDLVSCRTPDGPIPWTASALYADKKGLQPDVADVLWSVIRQMDLVERRWVAENLSGEGGVGA